MARICFVIERAARAVLYEWPRRPMVPVGLIVGVPDANTSAQSRQSTAVCETSELRHKTTERLIHLCQGRHLLVKSSIMTSNTAEYKAVVFLVSSRGGS